MKHIRQIRDFEVKIYGIHTHNKRNSPQTHDKIIPITNLRHKLSDKTDHFTRNSNFNSIVQLRSIFFYYHASFELYLKMVEVNWLIIFLTIIDEIFRK